MFKPYLAALLVIGAAPAANAATATYATGPNGAGIELTQGGGLAYGFTFASNCSNQQTVSGFRIKSSNGDEMWGVTLPSGSPTAAEALILDETKLAWALYYTDSSQGIPWEEINAGNLTKAKAC